MSLEHIAHYTLPNSTQVPKYGLSAEQELALSHTLEGGRLARAQLCGTKDADPTAHTDPEVLTLLEQQVEDAHQAARTLTISNLALADWIVRTSNNFSNKQHDRELHTFTDAKQYGYASTYEDDRLQAARIGLFMAAQNYQAFPINKTTGERYTEHVRFSTYAPWSIQSSISEHVRNNEQTGMRIPEHTFADIRRLASHPEEFTPKKAFTVTRRNVQQHCIPLDELPTSIASEEQPDSWSEPPALSIGEILQDHYENSDPATAITLAERTQTITQILQSLVDPIDPAIRGRKKAILERRHSARLYEIALLSDYFGLESGEPLSYREIGERHGRTKEAIRMRIVKTLDRIMQNPEALAALQEFRGIDTLFPGLLPHEISGLPGFANIKTPDVTGFKKMHG